MIRPVREIAHKFGGSHAQGDVIDLTLIEAAIRAGDQSLAKALVNERTAIKPNSMANKTLLSRVNGSSNQPQSHKIYAGAYQ